MDEPTYLEETAAYPLQALDPGSRDTVLERNDGSGFGDEDYAIYEDYVQNDSRPTSPEQSDTLSTSAISVPTERPKRSYGIGFITRAIEYLSTSPPPNVSSILIPPGMPTPSAMKSGRTPSPGDSVRARKRSITDERLFMSLEDVKDAEIAAVKAKYQRRKQAVIDAILMKGGSV
ncbi:hypothetical protein HDU99_006464 [Rhizoclosmatium hyalinum]|nr:hypothetical protein HDU99_006464 [Rhizoclosmatium hyalinum]